MKTINIFLASSSELLHDRNAFGNLVRRLDNIYEKRNMRIKLYEWEDDDDSFTFERKQNIYNEKIKESDIFIALFYKKAGIFTIEEFKTALNLYNQNKSLPKIYVYCRNLDPKRGEHLTPELERFQQWLINDLKQYWSSYDNYDSMRFHFVMQLWLLDNGVDIVVSNDRDVEIDGEPIVKMDKLSFVANNETYCNLKKELDELQHNNHSSQFELQKRKEELIELSQALFDTALRITKLKLSGVNKQLEEAINLFDKGKVEAANNKLDSIIVQADQHILEYERQKQQLSEKKAIISLDIEACLLYARTLMANTQIPIEQRIIQVNGTYAKADNLALRSDQDERIHAEILLEYGSFLNKFNRFDQAIIVMERQIELSKKAHGAKSLLTAQSYDEIGFAYEGKKDNDTAQKFYIEALKIRKRLCEKHHKDIATSMNNLGRIFSNLGDNENSVSNYKLALKRYTQALEMRKQVLGDRAPETAKSFNNVGEACFGLKRYKKAIENYKQALAIFQKTSNRGKCQTEIATVCNNLGQALNATGQTNEALKRLNRAKKIFMAELGPKHENTAITYLNLGDVYMKKKEYGHAADCYDKALEVFLSCRPLDEFVLDLAVKKINANRAQAHCQGQRPRRGLTSHHR